MSLILFEMGGTNWGKDEEKRKPQFPMGQETFVSRKKNNKIYKLIFLFFIKSRSTFAYFL